MAPRIDLLLSVLLLIVLPLSAHGQSSGIDLSLDQFIVQPGSGCGPRTIGAVISNQSAVTFAAPLILPITYTIDDGVNPVTNGQSIGFSFVSLIPGQPVMINLPGTIMLTEPLAHVITATLVINGDIVPANNIASTTILGPQPITSLPWLETFDGLGWNGLGDGSTAFRMD